MERYQQAFDQFEPAGTNEQVSQQVNKLLEIKEKENYTTGNFKLIYSCLDLTSLTTLDTKESIWKLVEGVNDFEGTRPDVPNVAAICVYPIFAETVKQALTAQNVKIACVSGGFPASQTFPEVKIAETSLALADGAEEIDIVMNLGYFLEENYQELTEEIQELKAVCQEAKLKVILETGALNSMEDIKKASILALYSGADFIKTSTGKVYAGASLEAVYIMCQTIKKYHAISGNKAGIKIAGGVRTPQEAIQYFTIVKEVLGEEWLSKDLFRIGASSLATEILKEIGE